MLHLTGIPEVTILKLVVTPSPHRSIAMEPRPSYLAAANIATRHEEDVAALVRHLYELTAADLPWVSFLSFRRGKGAQEVYRVLSKGHVYREKPHPQHVLVS